MHSVKSAEQLNPAPPATALRKSVIRTRGHQHGPVIRLVSPQDIGHFIKPFVFLDYFEARLEQAPAFGYHPHSGIATFTVVLNGAIRFEESAGASGIIPTGGVEWMRAGNGIWHTGGPSGTQTIKGYQLWLALPRELENGPEASQYLGPESFRSVGPARVMLGAWGGIQSQIAAPRGITYLDVNLRSGETWTFTPPTEETVAWIAIHQGAVEVAGEHFMSGEFVAFQEASAALTFTSRGEAAFILGSAIKHPYDLHCGSHSVHTSPEALQLGEDHIAKLGRELKRAGVLR